MSADDEDTAMKDFCAAVGELVIWANMVDNQLNKVVAGILALPDHLMVEPVIAQLDARQKVELLKKRAAKMPKESEWRANINRWLKHVEKLNRWRNTVAHHAIQVSEGGEIQLVSNQLSKIFDAISDDLKPHPRKGLREVREWVEQAKKYFTEGSAVVENAEMFRREALTRKQA